MVFEDQSEPRNRFRGSVVLYFLKAGSQSRPFGVLYDCFPDNIGKRLAAGTATKIIA